MYVMYKKSLWLVICTHGWFEPQTGRIETPIRIDHIYHACACFEGNKIEEDYCVPQPPCLFSSLKNAGIKALYSGHNHLDNYYGTFNGVRLELASQLVRLLMALLLDKSLEVVWCF